MRFFPKNKFAIWSFLVSNIAYIYIIYYYYYYNIRQNLHISVLILCSIFNILLPNYKHVFFNIKQSPRILFLSIILESLKNTLAKTYPPFCAQFSTVTFVKFIFNRRASLSKFSRMTNIFHGVLGNFFSLPHCMRLFCRQQAQ